MSSTTSHEDVFQICLTVAGEPHRRIVIEISEDCSINGLQQLAKDAFGQDCIDLKSGFPPKSLLQVNSPKESSSAAATATPLVRNVLNRNDRVTVMLADDKTKKKNNVIVKKKEKKDAPCETEVQSTHGRRSQRAASKAATESFSEVIKAQNRLLKEQKQQSTASKRKRTTDAVGKSTTSSSPKKQYQQHPKKHRESSPSYQVDV
ncbi:hypothetical protein MHU86_5427 [Fragilaria crotonensis]|nr:hypothetical protein MHU86_5427 [Fragilaria crotonensis]